MTIPADQIVALHRQRKTARGPLLAKMEEVRQQYDAEIVVPLPELDQNEKPAAVNLLGPGLDGLAQRMASVMPDVSCPAVRTGFETSEAPARARRRAVLGWWDMNALGMIQRKRFRWMLGYGSAPAIVRPTPTNPLEKRKIPFWSARNPLAVFPPTSDEHQLEPLDCIFNYRRNYAWLVATYPAQASVVSDKNRVNADTMFELLEYNDADETVLIVLGQAVDAPQPGMSPLWQPPGMTRAKVAPYAELERTPNRAGIPLTVIPGRITLTSVMGAFDSILGMFRRAARLDALETLGIQRSIFPEQWAVSHPASPGTVRIVREANAKRGVIGEIANGTIQTLNLQPSVQVPTAIDRIERAERLAAGVPAEMGGESASNIRTARRGEMVMGSAVDMPIQEHQEIMAAALEAENRRAIAVMKAYHRKQTSFYIPSDGVPLGEMYDPMQVFDTDTNFVKYTVPGADINGLVISLGQRLGDGTISQLTAMEMDPFIEDPAGELSRIQVDGLRRAMLASIEQGVQQGQIDPPTLARLTKLRVESPDKSLEECFLAVHDQMQKEQAAQAEQPPQPTEPEAQPGLGAQGAPAIPPPQPSQQNLAQILQTLRTPANQSKPEMAMAGGGQ